MHIQLVAESSSLIKRFFGLWGLSFLVDNDLLFDTFSNGKILLKALNKLNVSVSDIKYIVISHEHWDHSGGLWEILKANPKVKVYVCKDSSKEFKDKIRTFQIDLYEIDNIFEIKTNVFTTGQIKAKYKQYEITEQALVIKEKEGIKILTGCSHPGIVEIVSFIKKHFTQPIELLMGGFHLINKSNQQKQQIFEELRRLGVRKILPCHCSSINFSLSKNKIILL